MIPCSFLVFYLNPPLPTLLLPTSPLLFSASLCRLDSLLLSYLNSSDSSLSRGSFIVQIPNFFRCIAHIHWTPIPSFIPRLFLASLLAHWSLYSSLFSRHLGYHTAFVAVSSLSLRCSCPRGLLSPIIAFSPSSLTALVILRYRSFDSFPQPCSSLG
jgi:hypothetical protein